MPCLIIDIESEETHAEDSLLVLVRLTQVLEIDVRSARTQTNVAGKNMRVTTAIVFIEALSILAALLVMALDWLISIVALLSLCTTTLKPCRWSEVMSLPAVLLAYQVDLIRQPFVQRLHATPKVAQQPKPEIDIIVRTIQLGNTPRRARTSTVT